MKNQKRIWVCTHCGYSSSKRFEEDICPRCRLTFWKCRHCAFTLSAETAPDQCPECGCNIKFANITCYIPDWEENEFIGNF